jgi:hypothetical protein
MKLSSYDIQNKFLVYRLPSILMPKSMLQDVDKILSIIHTQEIRGVFIDFSHVDTIIIEGLVILNKILKGVLILGSECSISSVPSHLAQPLSEYLEKIPQIKIVQSFSQLISQTGDEITDKEFFTPEILLKIYGKDAISQKMLSHVEFSDKKRNEIDRLLLKITNKNNKDFSTEKSVNLLSLSDNLKNDNNSTLTNSPNTFLPEENKINILVDKIEEKDTTNKSNLDKKGKNLISNKKSPKDSINEKNDDLLLNNSFNEYFKTKSIKRKEKNYFTNYFNKQKSNKLSISKEKSSESIKSNILVKRQQKSVK